MVIDSLYETANFRAILMIALSVAILVIFEV